MRVVAVLGFLALACGASSPGSRPQPGTSAVEVPDAEPDEPAAEEVGDADATPGPTVPTGDCGASLRADPGLSAPGAETDAYERAFQLEQRDDLSSARRAYFEILKQTPSSPYVPLVYLAFAELFAREAAGDPTKWELARQAYREVAKYPPPANIAYAYAVLRLGDANQALADFPQALSDYKKVFDALASHPGQRCAAELADSAAGGIVGAYAEVGAPDKAWAFLKHVAADRGEELLTRLVDELLKRGKRPEACVAARSSAGASGASGALAGRACP